MALVVLYGVEYWQLKGTSHSDSMILVIFKFGSCA
jgi:hypothetical protein